MDNPLGKLGILDYKSAFDAGPEIVGGKAWSVCRLARYGFSVPAGFIIPGSVYRCFLKKNGLSGYVSKIENQLKDARNTARSSAIKLNADILSAPFPEDLRSSIQEKIDETHLKGNLAIRSSALEEDGGTHSFAGIYESRLQVGGLNDVCTAIKEVWASLWSPAALAYREARKITVTPECCVLINQMVPMSPGKATAAGVAFTCDPVTGQRDTVIINAISGWGDELAAGNVSGEQWCVDLRQRPLEAKREVSLSYGDVLAPKQAIFLAETAKRILWALGDGQRPLDMEWVTDGQKIWIVQVRPITNCPAPVLAGEKHLPRIWSNANVVESMPGVMRTISWEVVKMNLDLILYAPHRLSGYHIPSGLEPARRFKGRIMLDQTQLQYICHEVYGMPVSQFNHMIGGHQGDISTYGLPPIGIWKRLCCIRRGLRLNRRARRYQKGFTRRCEDIRDSLKVYARQNWRHYDNRALSGALGHILDLTLAFGASYAITDVNNDSSMLSRFVSKHFKDETHSIAAGLMAGAGNVLSAELGFRIDELARIAAGSPAAKSFLLSDPLKTSWRELPAEDPFRAQFDTFLDDFGHRCVYEGEIANPRWGEDPTYILAQIRTLIKTGLGPSPRIAAAQIQAKSKRRLEKLSRPSRSIALKLARKAQAGAARREAGKSTFSCHILPLRTIILEVGRRLVAENRINQVDDVFDMTTADLSAYLNGRWDGHGAGALIADRRSQRALWRDQTVPDVIIHDADGRRLPQRSGPGIPRRSSNISVKGIAVSPGVAEGRARIIRHPDDALRLHPGDVLVAPATDSAWTPLFLRASAIALEVGGYLSHASIVAREFGIPAVVNIPGLLEALEDEQMLRVDGDRGEIMTF